MERSTEALRRSSRRTTAPPDGRLEHSRTPGQADHRAESAAGGKVHRSPEAADRAAIYAATGGKGTDARIVDRYPYRATDGTSFEVVRVEWIADDGDRKKGTIPIRPVEGGYRLSRQGLTAYPFTPIDLSGAPFVVVAEGEKATKALARVGIPAVSSIGGTGAAVETDWSPLAGMRVVVWRDNDEPGIEYQHRVGALLARLGCSVDRCFLDPNTPPKADAADTIEYLEAKGLTPEQIQGVALAKIEEMREPWADPGVFDLPLEFSIVKGGALRLRPVDQEIQTLHGLCARRIIVSADLPFDPTDTAEAIDARRRRTLEILQRTDGRIQRGDIEVLYELPGGSRGDLRQLVNGWTWSDKVQARRNTTVTEASYINVHADDLPGDVEEIEPEIRAAVRSAISSGVAIANTGYAGGGKTTLTMEEVISGLASRSIGAGMFVLALPRRADVLEKLAKAQRIADGLPVEVLPLLGREEAAEAFACQEPDRIPVLSEAHHWICSGCPAKAVCSETPGQYLHDLEKIKRTVKGRKDRPLLLITTVSAREFHDDLVPKGVKTAFDDNPDPTQGFSREIDVKLVPLNEWIGRADLHLSDLRSEGWSPERAAEDYARGVAGREDRQAAWVEMADALLSKSDSRISSAAIALDRAVDFERETVRDGSGDLVRQGKDRGFVLRAIRSGFARGATPAKILAHLRKAERELDALPEVLLLDVLLRVARGLLRSSANRPGSLRKALNELPQELRGALRAGDVRQEQRAVIGPDGKRRMEVLAWPWERGTVDEVAPQMTSLLLDLAREVEIHGKAPLLGKRDREFQKQAVYLSTPKTLARARRGELILLGVGAIPQAILDTAGMEQTTVHARPRTLSLYTVRHETTIDPTTGVARVWSVGGQRQKRGGVEIDTTSDTYNRRVVRDHCEALQRGDLVDAKTGQKVTGPIGYVGHKQDREPLQDLVDAGLLRMVHYGDGHASTDELAGCQITIVRRFALPPDVVALQAERIRRALGIERPDPDDPALRTACYELRRWGPDFDQVAVRVPSDPIERDVQQWLDRFWMGNALERCRSLLAAFNDEARTVLFLNGAPCDLFGAEVESDNPEDYHARYGVSLDRPQVEHGRRGENLAGLNARRQKRYAATLDKAAAWIEDRYAKERAFGVADLADHLRVPTSTADRILRDLRADPVRLNLTRSPSLSLKPTVWCFAEHLELPGIRWLAKAAKTSTSTASAFSKLVLRELAAPGDGIDPNALLPRRGREIEVRSRLIHALEQHFEAQQVAERVAS